MDFMALLAAFFVSWQVRVMLGLILVDIILAIAGAIKQGQFEWVKLADFYRAMVVPYLLGYLALYVAINYIMPVGDLGEIGTIINQGLVTIAWAALVGALGGRIKDNFSLLYSTTDKS